MTKTQYAFIFRWKLLPFLSTTHIESTKFGGSVISNGYVVTNQCFMNPCRWEVHEKKLKNGKPNIFAHYNILYPKANSNSSASSRLLRATANFTAVPPHLPPPLLAPFQANSHTGGWGVFLWAQIKELKQSEPLCIKELGGGLRGWGGTDPNSLSFRAALTDQQAWTVAWQQ